MIEWHASGPLADCSLYRFWVKTTSMAGIAHTWPELLCVPEAPLARQLFAISCFSVASSNCVRLRFEWDAVFCRNLVVAGAAG